MVLILDCLTPLVINLIVIVLFFWHFIMIHNPVLHLDKQNLGIFSLLKTEYHLITLKSFIR